MPPGRTAGTEYVPLTPEEQAAIAAEQQAQQQQAPPPEYVPAYPSSSDISPSGRSAGEALGVNEMALPVEAALAQYEPAPVQAADPYAQDYAGAQMPSSYQPAPPPADPYIPPPQDSPPGPLSTPRTSYDALSAGSALTNEESISQRRPVYEPLAPQQVGGTGAITLPAPPNSGVNNPLDAFVQGANAQPAPYSGMDREAFYRVRDGGRAAEAVSPDRRERYEPVAPMSTARGAALNPALMRPTTGDYTPYQPIAPADPYIQPIRDNPPGPLRNEPGAERPVWEVLGEGAQGAWQGSEGARNALGSLTGVYRPQSPRVTDEQMRLTREGAAASTPLGRERPVWEALGEGFGGAWRGTEGARNALGTATGVYRGDVGRPTFDVLAGLGSLTQRGSSNAGMDKSVPPGGALPDVGALPSPPAPSSQGEVAHRDFPPGESYQPGQGDLRSQIDKAWNTYQPVPPGQSPEPGPNLPFDANSRPTLDFLNVFQRGGGGATSSGPLPAATVAQPSATDTPARSGQMHVLETMPDGMQRATDAAGIIYVGTPGADPVGIIDPETNEVVLYPTEEQISAILAKYDAIAQQATGAQTTAPATTSAAPAPVYEPTAPVESERGGGSSGYTDENGDWVWYNDFSAGDSGSSSGSYGGSGRKSTASNQDYNDVGSFSDLKLEDFLQDYNNNGDIDAQDRKRAKREFSAAMAKRKGTSRSRTRIKSAGFNPLDRPESPIRAAILDELDANLPGGVPARRKKASRS